LKADIARVVLRRKKKWHLLKKILFAKQGCDDNQDNERETSLLIASHSSWKKGKKEGTERERGRG
jgi:hypothetical protein